MAESLTDLSGIGAKTAEKLRAKGISSPRDLASALARGDDSLADSSKRVREAARQAQRERSGMAVDAFSGVRITDENEGAVSVFEKRDVTDINDAGRITRNNPDIQGETYLGLGQQAASGELLTNMRRAPNQQDIADTVVGADPEKTDAPYTVDSREDKEEMQIRRNIAEMGFDVAANVSEMSRETFVEANELANDADPRGTTNGLKTGFKTTYTSEIGGEEKEFERDVRATPRELAAAKRVQQARSPMAKRVDSRRRAPIASGFDEWIEDPSHTDFPGVDTPEKGALAGSAFGAPMDGGTKVEARAALDGGFEVAETSTDGGGGGRLSTSAGKILSAPQEQQKIVLGGLLPTEEEAERIGLEPRGPDENLFSDDMGGGFMRGEKNPFAAADDALSRMEDATEEMY